MAPVQVVIIPILGKGADAEAVLGAADKLKQELSAAGLATVVDTSDHKPGYKYFAWEQKGVPLRLELGPRDLAAGQVMVKDRLADGKEAWPMADLAQRVQAHLEIMQQRLYDAALKRRQDNTVEVDSYEDFKKIFAGDGCKFVMAHWDGTAATEAKIKEDTKATLRCIPLEGDKTPGRCMVTGAPSEQRVLFAKAY
jgi:prolyl-tRNA synthetase